MSRTGLAPLAWPGGGDAGLGGGAAGGLRPLEDAPGADGGGLAGGGPAAFVDADLDRFGPFPPEEGPGFVEPPEETELWVGPGPVVGGAEARVGGAGD